MTATMTPPALDVSATAPTPFARLVRLEWRKMMDTRAGTWLLGITGVLLVLAMAIALLVGVLDDNVRLSASAFSEIMTIPVSLLIPVFAVLVVTSEWSQRTHLDTFAREPHRLRIVGAKLVAVTALALATIAAAIAAGVVGNLLYGAITGDDIRWNLEASTLAWVVLSQVLFFLMGFGIGMVLLNTAGAIALFYVVGFLLPFMVYSTLYAIFDWAQDVLPWVDLTTATLHVMGEDYMGRTIDTGALEYTQFAVTAVIYVAVPILIGAWRVLRAEVK